MEPQTKIDLSRVSALNTDVLAEVRNLFEYHPWDKEQGDKGEAVRNALASAYRAIIESVPPCPTRTRALNMLTDCRMVCNAAITFKGRY